MAILNEGVNPVECRILLYRSTGFRGLSRARGSTTSPSRSYNVDSTRDDGGDRFQGAAAKRFAFGSESASLIVGEEYSFIAGFELFPENSGLFDQVGDRARLLMSYPASERGQEELQLDCRSDWATVRVVQKRLLSIPLRVSSESHSDYPAI